MIKLAATLQSLAPQGDPTEPLSFGANITRTRRTEVSIIIQ